MDSVPNSVVEPYIYLGGKASVKNVARDELTILRENNTSRTSCGTTSTRKLMICRSQGPTE
jgi:hypothetical protein